MPEFYSGSSDVSVSVLKPTDTALTKLLDERSYLLIRPQGNNYVPLLVTSYFEKYTGDRDIVGYRCINLHGVHITGTRKTLQNITNSTNHFFIYDNAKQVIDNFERALPKQLTEVKLYLTVVS